MEISAQQILRPKLMEMDAVRISALHQFHLALDLAELIQPEEKAEWKALSYLLTTDQLLEAQKEVTEESLKQLKIEQKLKTLSHGPV